MHSSVHVHVFAYARGRLHGRAFLRDYLNDALAEDMQAGGLSIQSPAVHRIKNAGIYSNRHF
jgi:hypothetical protein